MKLYLIQHGKALPKEANPDRPLSSAGITETRKTAETLGARDIAVDLIWHSPKKRAVQTAEIIAESIKCENVQERNDIKPLDPVENISFEITNAGKNIMIVGHLPFLQKLAGRLLTGSKENDLIIFKNSGVAALIYEEKWRIDWLLSPDLI